MENSIFSYWPFGLGFVALILFFLWRNGYLRINFGDLRSETRLIGREMVNVILYIIGYALVLLIFSTIFWDNWLTPFSLFTVTCLAITVGVLIAYLARKPFYGWAIIIIALAFLWFNHAGVNPVSQATIKEDLPETSAKYQYQVVQAGPILIFDGYTPCNPSIDYKYSLETLGDSIIMQFPGVAEPVFYNGKVGLRAPANRQPGPVHIKSANPNKEARVLIYKVP
jgi:hypothetical protein